MTREEAIQVLNTYDVNFDEYRAEEIAGAIDMAIEALSSDAILTKIQIDDIDKAKTSSQLLDDLAVDMVNAMGKRIVEVVRCKDCRYWEYVQDDGDCIRHTDDTLGYAIGTKADDFCSYGERRQP